MPEPLPLICDVRYTGLCVNTDTALERTFLVPTDINTDASTECAQYPYVPLASPYCVILGSTINVASGVTLRATGRRPLVLYSTGDITIDGIVDVSSRRATRGAVPLEESIGAGGNSAMCAMFRRAVDSSVDGGGGGAGGTFGSTGGDGGNGNYDVIAARAFGGLAPLEPDVFPEGILRGGCRGQDGGNSGSTATDGGKGGSGGGVVAVISSTNIVIHGAIAANGAGGGGGAVQAGGGGAGSGGLVILQGSTVHRAGLVTSNGGGGGEGGILDPIDGSVTMGADGEDGRITIARALGGNSTPPGSGGVGGARGGGNGGVGSTSDESAGGGGGSVGFIRIIGSASAANGAFESPIATFATN